MNKDRLLVLADFLETVPKEQFDLAQWRDGYDVSDASLLSGCGTTACAVGWACAIPVLQEQGLGWSLGPIGYYGYPQYDEYDGWDAVREFFRLSSYEAEYLFSDTSYREGMREATHVALRIRQYIDTDYVP